MVKENRSAFSKRAFPVETCLSDDRKQKKVAALENKEQHDSPQQGITKNKRLRHQCNFDNRLANTIFNKFPFVLLNN